jgi:hypothetical protein
MKFVLAAHYKNYKCYAQDGKLFSLYTLYGSRKMCFWADRKYPNRTNISANLDENVVIGFYVNKGYKHKFNHHLTIYRQP